jgi:hypothetical protein
MYLSEAQQKLNREIIRESIARDPVGRKLTDQAAERAAHFAEKSWTGQTGVGTAVEAGIRHVTSDVFKE